MTELRRAVQAMLSAEYGPSAVRAVARTAAPMASSYPADLVTVTLTDGRRLTLFRKDQSVRRYDSDLARRREVEVAVYRDILAGAGLGTAHYYGSVADPDRDRHWLLLAHVEGDCLRYQPFEVWVHAAAWLGRLHAYVAAHPEVLDRCQAVRPIPAAFYLATAAAARRAAAGYGAGLAARVERALAGYSDLVAQLAAQPLTLVHGSYRPQNILIARTSTSDDHKPGSMLAERSWTQVHDHERPAQVRVCPVDWETAALGPATYDLAYLSDGFDDERRGLLIDAYRAEAARHGLAVPADRDDEVLLDGCDLHKNLKTLAKAIDRGFPLAGVEKLVGMVEAAAARALPAGRHVGSAA